MALNHTIRPTGFGAQLRRRGPGTTIPAKCLADIEAWLLFRVFKTQEKGDRLFFYAGWSLNELYDERLSPDDELGKALAASCQVCPDLCAAVERQINKNSEIILGSVDYETIFQSIIRRHQDYVRHISIENRYRNTKSIDYDETFTLITANAIESIRTERLYENGKLNIKIVHRSGPWKPESPYTS